MSRDVVADVKPCCGRNFHSLLLSLSLLVLSPPTRALSPPPTPPPFSLRLTTTMSFLIVDFAFTRFGRKHYGCCVDPLQSLDLVRDALQRYINKEVDDLLQRYRTVKPFEEMTNEHRVQKNYVSLEYCRITSSARLPTFVRIVELRQSRKIT